MKFENVCRTCLKIPEIVLSLVENKELLYKIKIISSVEIQLEDDYPMWICEECVENLNRSFNFREVIINSDVELRERHAVFFTEKKINKEENMNDENNGSDLNEGSCLPNRIAFDENDRWEVATAENVNEKKRTHTDSNESTKTETYKCTKCNYECTVLSEWNTHKKSHVLMRVCDSCGKTVSSNNFLRHLYTHMETPVKCPHPGCDKMFKNPLSIRFHVHLHKEGVTKYRCEYCGKSYSYRSGYYHHKKRHVGDGTGVKCEICGKVLTEKKKMKDHMRSHTGERPYLCEYCGKGFASRYARSVHNRLHTKEKPYPCDYCNQAFRVKVSLQTHITSKHKDIIESS